MTVFQRLFLTVLMCALFAPYPACAQEQAAAPHGADQNAAAKKDAAKDDAAKAAPETDNQTSVSVAEVLNPATPSERVAAIVNDDIITTSDIRARMALAFLTSNLPPTPENQERLLPQVLRGLIDEQLQLQEAKRDGLAPDPAEEQKVLAKIAGDNNVAPDKLNDFLVSHNIPPATLERQVYAYLSWSKVVQTKLRPLVEIGDEEIQSRIDRMKANDGKPEYLLAEIFLAVDNPRDEPQIKALADRLASEIRQGAMFGATAQQFSQGLGARQGGDLGWIELGQLAPELDAILPSLQKGQISDPIRAGDGYHILLLRDERIMSVGSPADAQLKLVQLTLPLASLAGADSGVGSTMMRVAGHADAAMLGLPSGPGQNAAQIPAAKEQAEKLRASLTGCDRAADAAKAMSGDWQVQTIDSVRLGDETPQVQEALLPLKPGELTPPLVSEQNVAILLVCDRHEAEGALLKETIANAIGLEKLDMQARRLLRDLRRTAFIDVRIK